MRACSAAVVGASSEDSCYKTRAHVRSRPRRARVDRGKRSPMATRARDRSAKPELGRGRRLSRARHLARDADPARPSLPRACPTTLSRHLSERSWQADQDGPGGARDRVGAEVSATEARKVRRCQAHATDDERARPGLPDERREVRKELLVDSPGRRHAFVGARCCLALQRNEPACGCPVRCVWPSHPSPRAGRSTLQCRYASMWIARPAWSSPRQDRTTWGKH